MVVAENPVKSVTDIFVASSCFFRIQSEEEEKFLSCLRYTRSGPDGSSENVLITSRKEKRPMGPIGILSRDRQTDDS